MKGKINKSAEDHPSEIINAQNLFDFSSGILQYQKH